MCIYTGSLIYHLLNFFVPDTHTHTNTHTRYHTDKCTHSHAPTSCMPTGWRAGLSHVPAMKTCQKSGSPLLLRQIPRGMRSLVTSLSGETTHSRSTVASRATVNTGGVVVSHPTDDWCLLYDPEHRLSRGSASGTEKRCPGSWDLCVVIGLGRRKLPQQFVYPGRFLSPSRSAACMSTRHLCLRPADELGLYLWTLQAYPCCAIRWIW